MKKRILAFLLAVLMVVSLLPMTAAAATSYTIDLTGFDFGTDYAGKKASEVFGDSEKAAFFDANSFFDKNKDFGISFSTIGDDGNAGLPRIEINNDNTFVAGKSYKLTFNVFLKDANKPAKDKTFTYNVKQGITTSPIDTDPDNMFLDAVSAYVFFTVPVSEPVFDLAIDSTTITKDNFSSYVKGTTKVGDYTFAGWFDGETEYTGTYDAATAGTTYTAKWTNAKGKTVLTQPAIVTSSGVYVGGTTTNGVYNNDGTKLEDNNEYGISYTDAPVYGTLALDNASIVAEAADTGMKYAGTQTPVYAVLFADSSLKEKSPTIKGGSSNVTVLPGDYSGKAVCAIFADYPSLGGHRMSTTVSDSDLVADASGATGAAVSAGAMLGRASVYSKLTARGGSGTESYGITASESIELNWNGTLDAYCGNGTSKMAAVKSTGCVSMSGSAVLTTYKNAGADASKYTALETGETESGYSVMAYDKSKYILDGKLTAAGQLYMSGNAYLSVMGAVSCAEVTPDTVVVINGTKAVSPAKGYTQTDSTKPIIFCFSPFFDPANGSDVILGEAGKLPEAPTWEGYTFGGWFAPGATEPVAAASVAAGVTYTAKWTNAKGNTVLTQPITVKDKKVYIGGAEQSKDSLAEYGIEAILDEELTLSLTDASIVVDPEKSGAKFSYDGVEKDVCAAISLGDNQIYLNIDSDNSSITILGEHEDMAVAGIYAGGKVGDIYRDIYIGGDGLTIDASKASGYFVAPIICGNVNIVSSDIEVFGGSSVMPGTFIVVSDAQEATGLVVSGDNAHLTVHSGTCPEGTEPMAIRVEKTYLMVGFGTPVLDVDGNVSAAEVTVYDGVANVNGSIQVNAANKLSCVVLNATESTKDSITTYAQTDATKPIVLCNKPIFDLGNGKTILGEAGKLPTAPTWTGYTFAGWYTDVTYATAVDAEDVGSGATFYAKWTNAKGNTVLTRPITVKDKDVYIDGARQTNDQLEEYGIECSGEYTFNLNLTDASIVVDPTKSDMKFKFDGEEKDVCAAISLDDSADIYANNSSITILGEHDDQAVAGIYDFKDKNDSFNTIWIYGDGLTIDASKASGYYVAPIICGQGYIYNTDVEVFGGSSVKPGTIIAGSSGWDDEFKLSQDDSKDGHLTVHSGTCPNGTEPMAIRAAAILNLGYASVLDVEGNISAAELRIDSEEGADAVARVKGTIKVKEDGLECGVVLNATESTKDSITTYAQIDATKPIVLCNKPIFDLGNGEQILGEAGKLPTETPVWTGYTFAGWYTDKTYATAAKAEDVGSGATFYAKWTDSKTGKTVLMQPVEVKKDGVYLNGTLADATELAKYGIKFTAPANDGDPAILELDGATIMAPGKYTGLIFSGDAGKIYSLISNRTGSMEIAVKSESNIISTGVDVDGTEDINLFNIYVNNGNLTFSGETLNIVTDGRNESQFTAGVYNSKEDADNIIRNKINVTVKNTARGRGICVAKGNMTICGKAVVNSNVSGSGALYGIYVTKNLLIKDDAIVTTDAKSTAANAYGIAAKQGEITDNAVVTAKADGGNENANGIQIFGNEGEGLVIGGNAVVNAYGGNGTKKVYAVDSVKTVIIKDNAKLYAYGGLNSASGEKDAMYIVSKNYLYLRDNAQLIADGSLPFGEERSIVFEGEPCNAFLSAMGDVKAYVTGMVTSVNGNGEFKDDAGFTQKNKNAPIIFTGKQCKVDLDGILTGYGYFCGLITKPDDPVKDGYKFGGWYSDEACTQAWNFESDVPTGDMKLYPKWIKEDTAVEISGKLVAGSELGSEGENNAALVEVYDGENCIKSVLTGADGAYSLGYLTPGDYELRITANGRTVSELLHVEEDYTPADVSLVGGIGTEVEIVESGSDTPHVIVGGLSKLADAYKGGDRSDLAFVVEAQTAAVVSVDAKEAISDLPAAKGKQVSFVDMSIFREYIGGAKNGERDPIHDAGYVMEIVMNYDTSNRKNIQVFRYHDDEVNAPETITFTELAARPTNAADYKDGTYYVGNGFIVVYTQYFSEYAIGYTTESGHNVNLPADIRNGRIEISPESASVGETVTIKVTPDKGCKLNELTVKDANGNTVELTMVDNSTYTFSMPDSNVNIFGSFAKVGGDIGGNGGAISSNVAVENIKNGKLDVSPKNASAGSTVTITVTPDKGYKLETLTVLDKNGGEVEVKSLGDNRYIFTMPDSKVTISATFIEDNAMPDFFVDVKEDDYYYDAVLWAAENGITKGTDDVHFGPDLGTTRAQVVTFLWRAAGCPVVNYYMNMSDVKSGEYYTEAVRWALAEGITKGTSTTTFEPDAVCTRGQIVTFLARFAGVEDADTASAFTDVKSTDFFAAAVKWAKDNEVTNGTSETTFSPNDDCLRAQAVTFLYRWMVK